MDSRHKSCFVPYCLNTTIQTPNKKFVTVPKNNERRMRWFEAVRRTNNPNNTYHCCEDHFDLQNDMENYLKYSMMGGNIILKKNVDPHIFDWPQTCSKKRRLDMPSCIPRQRRMDAKAYFKDHEFVQVNVKEEFEHDADNLTSRAGPKEELYEPLKRSIFPEDVECSVLADVPSEVKIEIDITENQPTDCNNLDIKCENSDDYPKLWSTEQNESCSTSSNTLFSESTHVITDLNFHKGCTPRERRMDTEAYFEHQEILPVRLKEELEHHSDSLTSKLVFPDNGDCSVLADVPSEFKTEIDITESNLTECNNLDIECENSDDYTKLWNAKQNESCEIKCEICYERFTRNAALAIHLRIHNGQKAFKCQLCPKQFNAKPNLIRHLKIHSGEKPFKCEICSKQFVRKSNLKPHMRCHTGEKPFECGLCLKKFRHKVNLIYHLMLHKGEKQFKCEMCSKQFCRKSDLTYHLRTHSGEKPFKCKTCSKQFTHKSILNKHLRIHTGDKPFKCYICSKQFIQKSHIIKHMRTHAR